MKGVRKLLILGVSLLLLFAACSQDLLNQVLGTATTAEGTEINYEIMGLMLAYPSYSAVDAAMSTAFDGIGMEETSGPIQIDTIVNVEGTVRLTLNGTYTYDTGTGTLTIQVDTGSLSIEGTTPIYDENNQRIADISRGTLDIRFSVEATVVENPDYPGDFYPSSLTIQSFTIDGSVPVNLRDSKYKDGNLVANSFKVRLQIEVPNADASPYEFTYNWQYVSGSISYADEDVTQQAFDELKIAFPQVLDQESDNDTGSY
ncbi:MAG: hypothetical protein Kow009_07800 [Spirochaetales bacterium]